MDYLKVVLGRARKCLAFNKIFMINKTNITMSEKDDTIKQDLLIFEREHRNFMIHIEFNIEYRKVIAYLVRKDNIELIKSSSRN